MVIPFQVFLGALPLAVELVNQDPELLPGYELKYKAVDIGRNFSVLPIKWDINPTTTTTLLATHPITVSLFLPYPLRSMTEMRDTGVLAFVGPDNRCTPEALVASAWNLPMISYVSGFIDKTLGLFSHVTWRHLHTPSWALNCSEGGRQIRCKQANAFLRILHHTLNLFLNV